MLDPLTVERMLKAAGEGPILIALSGGGDSVALVRLLAEHVGAERLHAAVVDHGLRQGSAEDARLAKSDAEAAGVRAYILTLAWASDANRAQQAARSARYRVLCDHARALGARVIALGHTADDQAETVFMRAAAGSTWRGLAAIAPLAPAPAWPEGRGLLAARPLLGARRISLRSLLQNRGAAWIEDPANENPMFERVRVRARLAALEQAGFDPMRLTSLAARLRAHVDRMDAAARELIAEAVTFEADRALVNVAQWRGSDEVRRRALSALVTAAGGAAREPAPAALDRLEARVASDDFRGATLAGAALSPKRGRIVISRDPGALHGRAGGAEPIAPFPLPAEEEAVWDGRLLLRAPGAGWRVVVENGAPVLLKDGARAPVAYAAAEWLIRARLDHVLGAERGESSNRPINAS